LKVFCTNIYIYHKKPPGKNPAEHNFITQVFATGLGSYYYYYYLNNSKTSAIYCIIIMQISTKILRKQIIF